MNDQKFMDCIRGCPVIYDRSSNDFNPIQMGPTCQLAPSNFYRRLELDPKPSEFQFQPSCYTGVKTQGHTQCQSQIIELEPRPSLKKKCFFWSNSYKIEVIITSLIEMLDLSDFGHMTTSAIQNESCDKVLLVISWT